MAKTIYEVVAGAVPTVLTKAYTDGDTSISVASTKYIPKANNHVTIRDGDDYFVTVLFTGISGNTLTGISYVEGIKGGHVYPLGSSVVRCIDKYDFDAITENLQEKQDRNLGVVHAGESLIVGEDGNITTGTVQTEAVWGKITGDITKQIDLENEFVKQYQGTSNVNRPLVVGDNGDVVLGSKPTTPYVEDETCIFPTGSYVHVEDHTVMF